MPPVVQVQVQRAPGDCAICALSMLLGLPYEDVLGAAAKTTHSARVHHVGLSTREMKATAKHLGVVLVLHRGFDLEVDEGLLSVANPEKQQHAVLLKSGLVFDGDGTVWEPAVFIAHYNFRPLSLLVRKEE